ncbi:L-threonylcarbamoyladenylate synthase [uncultured Thiothrix sp.]|uniref:L-threonylcarbamoyladenylate synthase n=1 Tax=uncultured Thiothrix sp. TaxID=223185 RepID=UPI0026183013|nr:L-threonylcarbamoyladenylate synthase [uncultured Thiothrix sp.]
MRISTQIEEAVAVVKSGGLIAYPTEAVFGLGCDPQNEAALQRLLELKQRPAHKGLILIAAELEQVIPYLAPLTPEVLERILPTWPGPYTWLLPVNAAVSPLVKGKHDTLAVRISAHPVCQALCRQLGTPLISTSANPANQTPARDLVTLQTYFADQLDLILDLPLGQQQNPSEIRNALTGKLIRPS